MNQPLSQEAVHAPVAPGTIVASQDLTKKYGDQVVLDVPGRVEITEGFTAIVGESGSGKSTYLNVLAGFVSPTTGYAEHYADDSPVYRVETDRTIGRGVRLARAIAKNVLTQTRTERSASAYRSGSVGYIAQQPAMHPYLTMREYIDLTHTCRGNRLNPDRYAQLAETLGITALLDKKPSELSGGEEQRGAIVSALVHRPRLIFADEPTSALDPENSQKTVKLFRDICDNDGTSVIMVTHNPELVKAYADNVIEMSNGKIIHTAR